MIPSDSLTNPHQFDFSIIERDESSVFSPGLTAPFSLIPTFLKSIKNFFNSVKNYDNEQIIEHFILVFNLPIGIASSIEHLIQLLVLLARGITLMTLSLTAAIMGFVFLTLELALEIGRLIRTVCFSKKHHIKEITELLAEIDAAKDLNSFVVNHRGELSQFIPLETLNDLNVTAHTLQKHLIDNVLNGIYKDHLIITEEELEKLNDRAEKQGLDVNELAKTKLRVKGESLIRRIHPTAVRELFKHFREDSLDVENGKKLISTFNTQLDKTLLVHIVGIVAISLAAISLALTFIFASPIIPGAISVLGIGIEVGRGLAPAAFLDQQGYKWDYMACLPNCLRRRWEKLSPQETTCT